MLRQLLSSARYHQVLCVNLDRNSQDLLLLESLAVESVDSYEKKLVLLEEHEQFLAGKDILDTTIAMCAEYTSNEHSSYAVVVYSLSEVILLHGIERAMEYIDRLSNALFDPINLEAAALEGSKKMITSIIPPVLILVLHQSLHTPQIIALVKSMVNTVVHVVPNDGTMAKEVLGEVQTIRRSNKSGKVNESVEMISCREGLLHIFPKVSSSGSSASFIESSSAGVAEVTSLMPKAITKPVDNKTLSVQSSMISSTGPSRLITFDSTDPEFDEDSDPDADLDL